MKVPFVDLQAQLRPIRNEIDTGIAAVLDKCNFILGEEVSQFERAFADYCKAKYAVGVASGLDAIHLAMLALGVGPGDEVIVPAHTFIASALGVTMVGARPVFVDINPDTFLMDVAEVEKAITPRTKAIMPVHLYGRIMDLSSVIQIAKKYNLFLVEDAAQAHGARLGEQFAGTYGHIGCFSFYPGKNLGCYGDGGAIVTNDAQLKAKIEAFRNYGSTQKYHHPIVGVNSRLDTIQAAILNVKLPHLDQYNRARYQAACRYSEALSGLSEIQLPEVPPAGSHVFHLYVIRTSARDRLLEHLNKQGVGAGIHYPTPVHLHGAYQNLNYREGSFPMAEQICKEIVSLPIFPEITDEQIDFIATEIRRFFKL